MFKTLRSKMIFSFSLIILLSITTIDYIVLTKYIDEKLSDLKSRSFAKANIIADQSQHSLNYNTELRTIIFNHQDSTEGRILILNDKGKVIVDSLKTLEGKRVISLEVKKALNNTEDVNLYSTPSKVMQLAVPISSGLSQNNPLGVVLLSLPIDDIHTSFNELRGQVIFISIIFGIIAIALTIIASQRLTSPLKRLTRAAKKISRGSLGVQVRVSGKDEIAQFSRSFNTMSKELEYIDKNRTAFISSVSHELKTPLASMKALIQPLLGENIDRGTYREFLGDIDGEIDRLSNLITTLLTLTKLEELKANSKLEDIKPIVDRVINILSPIAKEANVTLINKLPENLELYLDKDLITEVFLNLIENGIKYRRPGEESYVLVDLKDSLSTLEIIIKDNGIGIDNAYYSHIFKPFYRIEHSRSRLTGGHGLGLSIVAKIISLHSWNIEVESKAGRQSIFTIKIPK